MVWRSFKSGLARAGSTKRLLLVLYLASLLAGIFLALPLRSVIRQFAGHTLMGSELVEGTTADFLAELVVANRALVPGLVILVVFGAVSWCLLSLFLSGGTLAILIEEKGYRASAFWRGAGAFFGRFLRLALWSVLLLAALSLLPLGARWAQSLIFGPDPYQYFTFWGAWIRIGVDVLALFFFRIVFDYARIHAVMTNEKKMRRSLWQGVRFVTGNPIQTVGLATTIPLLGVAALVIYIPLSGGLDGSTTALVVSAIVLQQLYVWWRVALRVVRYGSQIALYQGVSDSRATVPTFAEVLADHTP